MRCKPLPDSTQRRGILTIELILTLPILLIVILASLEFTMLFLARGQVAEAARVGARKAMLAGATEETVEEEVARVLSPRLRQALQVGVELAEHSGDVVAVGVNVPMAAAAPDLLWPVGFSLQGRSLHCETRMVRE